MHADVWEQRQAGCSCWAGWEMLDGTRLDPYCEADEWHARREWGVRFSPLPCCGHVAAVRKPK